MTDAWTSAANMKQARSSPTVVAVPGGDVYVFGGQNGGYTQSNAEAYRPRDDAWRWIAPLPRNLSTAGAAVGSDGRIYVFGGASSDPSYEIFDTTYVYDPAADSWSRETRLGATRAYIEGLRGTDGRLYSLGGSTFGPSNWYPADSFPNLATVEALVDSTGAWTTLPSLRRVTAYHGAAVGPDGRIYVFGGRSGGVLVANVEAYGPSIALSPAAGPAGTVVTVSGSSFAPNAAVRVFWGPPPGGTELGRGRSDASGALTDGAGGALTITVPFAQGRDVVAMDDRSALQAIAPFALSHAAGPPSFVAAPPCRPRARGSRPRRASTGAPTRSEASTAARSRRSRRSTRTRARGRPYAPCRRRGSTSRRRRARTAGSTPSLFAATAAFRVP